MKKVFPLLAILVVLYSCNQAENDFYNDYVEEDLNRLPLIRPYKLITNMNEEYKEEHPSWGLVFTKEYTRKNKLKDDHVNIRVVNIEDSIIYGGPGRYERHAIPDFWFIINTKTSDEMIFEDEESWKAKLTVLNCKQDTLYDIWPIFEIFKKDGTLPWPKPQKK
jgi:hypothetical protein